MTFAKHIFPGFTSPRGCVSGGGGENGGQAVSRTCKGGVRGVEVVMVGNEGMERVAEDSPRVRAFVVANDGDNGEISVAVEADVEAEPCVGGCDSFDVAVDLETGAIAAASEVALGLAGSGLRTRSAQDLITGLCFGAGVGDTEPSTAATRAAAGTMGDAGDEIGTDAATTTGGATAMESGLLADTGTDMDMDVAVEAGEEGEGVCVVGVGAVDE